MLLNNLEIIRWCYEGITEFTMKNTTNKTLLKKSKIEEDVWGNKIIDHLNGNQWTTKFCQDLVKESLIKLGRTNVKSTTSKKSSLRKKKYSPDLECDEYVYEVKGRNWSTSGTAGEKILGVPLKYGEIPRLYKKPLKVILVGYQEFEARHGFAFGDLLDDNNQTPELIKSLDFFKKQKIEYIGFTDILDQLGFSYGCWNK